MAGHQLPPAERRRAKLTQAAAEELRVPSRLPPARSAQQRLIRQHPIRPREILRQIPHSTGSTRQILSRRWDASNRVLTGTGETLPDRNEEAPSAWPRTTIPVPAAHEVVGEGGDMCAREMVLGGPALLAVAPFGLAAYHLNTRSQHLLAASVTHAMAVAVGASRTPGGLRIAP